jgi:hypothetical protein
MKEARTGGRRLFLRRAREGEGAGEGEGRVSR